jgi:lipoprotein-releasing system ATP-binding protein
VLLQLKNISKSYSNRAILDELCLDVDKGESIAITGPSGSGKTTLLNLVSALDQPDSGEIIFDGNNIAGLSAQQLAGFRNRQIGFVFQMHHLLPQLSLWENVLLPTLVNPEFQGKEAEERAKRLTERTGIQNLLHQKPGELSGGECQRTVVVRALINKPKLLLADEPTGALDQHSASALADLLVQLNKEEGTALITVTHSMPLAEKMEKVYRLEDGRLVREK